MPVKQGSTSIVILGHVLLDQDLPVRDEATGALRLFSEAREADAWRLLQPGGEEWRITDAKLVYQKLRGLPRRGDRRRKCIHDWYALCDPYKVERCNKCGDVRSRR